MPKPKKDKLIDFDGKMFTLRTTVHSNGVSKPRVLNGIPEVRLGRERDHIQIGCMKITVKALERIFECWALSSIDLIQRGNY